VEAEGRTRPDADGAPPSIEIAEREPEPRSEAGPEAGPDPQIDAAAPNERCAHHAARAAVARCGACGEPVCIICAVPVRGRILGPGCVAAELGDPALVAPTDAGAGVPWAAVAGALVALAGTAGPWTRTGAGDRLLGAWVPDVRWSMIAAIAAVALLAMAWWSRRRDPSGRVLVGALGAVVLLASVLAIVFPPTFQAASWGPWVTVAGALIAMASALRPFVSGSGRTQGV
jgi:hypothetical protein